ncbi:hypothetical protein PFICI_00656 [Pestalotiopsis fici W106-1]|uniref:Cytochrome b561 domain-containing protein n=1 Tax=Pestalotiopsis fici (strain W106-1 / CGMCC3.15140) TaxID=1229662 RepID=W3XL86_PESFW|nr:uncharacterized protein PFICI_00656 [Pestalotiopsis fici W106-1]ETS86828.1 hypothetical protein PFICI_00656 [Pestalotiopsis fici W106-1]
MYLTFLGLLASATTAHARGQWGDDYDGGGPGWGYYYGGSGNDDDGFGSGFGSGIGIDYAKATRYRTAHGALAALAFVGLFPIGAIIMRLVPGRLTWLVHGIFQLIAYAVFISAAALGIYLVRMVRIPPDGRSLLSIPTANAHPIIGIIILVVLFFQPALGWFHHLRFKRLGCRTACSHAHIWVGRIAVTLGIINGGLGLQLARASRPAVIAYSVIAAIVWLTWVAAAVIGERRRRSNAVPTAAAAGAGGRRLGGRDPRSPYSSEPINGGPIYTRRDGRGVELGAMKRGRGSSSNSSVSSYSPRR